MSSSANDINTMNGLFKQTYADKLRSLVPANTKLLEKIKFIDKGKQPGSQYNMPLQMTLEHGVTYAAANEGAFALNQAIAGQSQEAQVKGAQMLLRSAIGYDTIVQSRSSSQAFEQAQKFILKSMMKSMARKLEAQLFYGQLGLATVASVSGNVITVTTAEWAPGLWIGGENMKIEVYSSTGTLRGEAQITLVDIDARTITVNALPVGTTGTDVIYEKSAKGKEMAGLHKIMTNTGTLFNIDAATYSLWKGNSFSASSAALDLSKVEDAVAQAVGKGLDSDVDVFVNPKAWSDLLVEQAAKRSYDQSYSVQKSENGSKEICFFGQSGEIRIVPSVHVKEGYAYGIVADDLHRVGASDIMFGDPISGGEAYIQLGDNAGVGLRAYSNQALFCEAPSHTFLINNIVN